MTIHKRQVPDESGMIYLDYYPDEGISISQDPSPLYGDDDTEQIIFISKESLPSFKLQIELLFLEQEVDDLQSRNISSLSKGINIDLE
jgi:hypothetical protein